MKYATLFSHGILYYHISVCFPRSLPDIILNAGHHNSIDISTNINTMYDINSSASYIDTMCLYLHGGAVYIQINI